MTKGLTVPASRIHSSIRFLRSVSTLVVLSAVCAAGQLSAQSLFSAKGIPTAPEITSRSQVGIDEDILRWHIGDVPVSATTHDLKYLDYASKNWLDTSNALYDTHYHLFFRDKTFIGKTDSAGKPIFWSRGNGWVMGGLVRTLQFMPKDYPDRARYETQLREMAAELASIQDTKNGLWHSDLLDPADYPQPEVSGSSLITFALAWGVNHGVLDRATYTPVIAKAWRGLVDQIYADGRLGNIQQTDGAPNHYLPSSSFNFGVGGFLLAGSEIAHLGRP
jgi:hypothetical protein